MATYAGPDLIDDVCRARGWSGSELARRLNVTHHAIRSWRSSSLPPRREEQLRSLLAESPPPIDVRQLRLRLGWTVRELAARVGVHRVTIAHWEGGQPVPPKKQDLLRELEIAAPNPVRATRERLGCTQLELARALRVSVAQISRWESDQRRPPARYLQALQSLAAPDDVVPAPHWIRRQRMARALSYGAVARQLGGSVRPTHVREWESGTRAVPARHYRALRRLLRPQAAFLERDRGVLQLVRGTPGMSVRELLDAFPAHDHRAVLGALQRHLDAGRLFRAKGAIEDGQGRRRNGWRLYPEKRSSEHVVE